MQNCHTKAFVLVNKSNQKLRNTKERHHPGRSVFVFPLACGYGVYDKSKFVFLTGSFSSFRCGFIGML